MDTIAAQRKFLAQQRSEAIRNKPPTKNQLKNGNYKHAELKIKKFEEVQALYEKIKRGLMKISSLLGLLKDENEEKEVDYGYLKKISN
ncbi:hypothetical protein Tco_1464810 [Tanacetum coccineum]